MSGPLITAVALAVGIGQIREWIVASFQSYASLLLPLCFVAFFVVTAIALAYHRRQYVKRTYIAGFLAILVTINLIGLPILPMMYWHKFSEPRPESQTHYQIRLVTAEGKELSYPVDATLSVDSVSFSALLRQMRTEFSSAKNQRITRYLLKQARDYHRTARDQSVLRYLRFPPHGFLESWDRETVRSHFRLVGIRFYRINLTTSPDGTEITSRSKTLLFECFSTVNASKRPSTAISNNSPRVQCSGMHHEKIRRYPLDVHQLLS